MPSALVIDVGTHKAQEVFLFEGRPRYSLVNLLRLLRTGNPFSAAAAIRRSSKRFKTEYSCRYVLIEPVMHRELLQFVKSVSGVVLINGVSSCDSNGPTILLMAKNSLGNSLIPSKPGLTGETRETFNLNFPALYEYAVASFGCDKIIIRINAEGVEGPIIDFLAKSASVKPDVIAGSIGDIKKCFGQDAYDKAMAAMEDADIPFVYFTSSARTWASGLNEIETVFSSPAALRSVDTLRPQRQSPPLPLPRSMSESDRSPEP